MKRPESVRIGFLVHDVSRLRRTAFDARVKPMNITRSQWWVLSGVSRHHHEGITQTELAQVLDLGKVALGNLVDRLEESGYVERRQNLSDRRVNLIHLTVKGHGILKKMEKVSQEMNARIMKGVSVADQHQLARTLAQMKVNLIAMDTVPGTKLRGKVAGLP